MTSALAAFAVAVCLGGCEAGWRGFERDTLNPGVPSGQRPLVAAPGLERIAVPSGERSLDARLARPGAGCPASTAAVLVFHGRNETVADWAAVQALLGDQCIASMTVDYSGHGSSTPPGTIANLNQDAESAARAFVQRFAGARRRCVLGFSMGAALALQATAGAGVPVDCVVLVSPFDALRGMAVRSGTPRAVTAFLSDAWNNTVMAARLDVPLLWVHSEDDEIVPVAAGRAVYDAAGGPKAAATLRGFGHNAIHRQRPPEIWEPILRFVQD